MKRDPWKTADGRVSPGYIETTSVDFDIDGRAVKVRIKEEAAPGWHTCLREVWCGEVYARDFSGEDTYEHDHPNYPTVAWLVSLARHMQAGEAITHTAVLPQIDKETSHVEA